MICKVVEERLLLEFKTAAPAEEVQKHLLSCPACQKLYYELNSLQDLSHLLGGTVQAPADFESRVLAAAGRERIWQRVCKPALAMTLVLVFSAGAFWKGTEQAPGPAAESAFVESVDAPGSKPEITVGNPLPSKIEIRKTQVHSDFYLTHVSH